MFSSESIDAIPLSDSLTVVTPSSLVTVEEYLILEPVKSSNLNSILGFLFPFKAGLELFKLK